LFVFFAADESLLRGATQVKLGVVRVHCHVEKHILLRKFDPCEVETEEIVSELLGEEGEAAPDLLRGEDSEGDFLQLLVED